MKKFWEVFLITSVFFVALALWLPLSDQEAYYWLWSKHPALCYFDHPPLQAWITHVMTLIFGDNVFSVRAPIVLARGIGLWYFFRWCRLRLDANSSYFALLIVISSFYFMGASLLALPDSYQFPFAMMVLYYADTRQALKCGFTLGLMALAKWTAAVYVPGIMGAFLLINGRKRDWLRLTLTGLIALAMQAPVLYWNAIRGWPSFMFHLETRHKAWSEVSAAFVIGNFFTFFAAQIFLGCFGTTLLLFWVIKSRFKIWERVTTAYSPLWLWIVPAFLIFGNSALKGEMRFYWTAPAFFPLTVALIQRVHKVIPSLQNFSRVVGWFSYTSCGLIFVALMYPVGAYLKPLSEKYTHFDMRQSPRGDIEGWDDWIKSLRDDEKIDVGQTAFYASDMRLAAQAAWALRNTRQGQAFTQVATTSPHQNAFLYWPHPRPEQFTKAIMFYDNRYHDIQLLDGFCDRYGAWHVYEVRLKNEVIKEIHWNLCESYRWPANRTRDWF